MMVRCKYIFEAGDKQVMDGKKQIGEQCSSLIYPTENNMGFCGGHLKKYNRIHNPEKNAEIGRKQSDTARANRLNAIHKNKEIVDNCNDTLSEKTKEIMRVLGKQEKYDLISEYSTIKVLNPSPLSEKYAEKFAFAMWMNTPEMSRTPKTVEEVAPILGVSVSTLALWRRSPELVKIVNDKATEAAIACYPYVWEKLMERVHDGSERAMVDALKHIKELITERGGKPKPLDLSPSLLDEARKINETGSPIKVIGVTDKAKKADIYDALVNGDIKPTNETVQ